MEFGSRRAHGIEAAHLAARAACLAGCQSTSNVEAGFRYGMDWGLKAYAAHEGSAPTVNLLYTYTGTFSDIALGSAADKAKDTLGL